MEQIEKNNEEKVYNDKSLEDKNWWTAFVYVGVFVVLILYINSLFVS